MFAPLAKWAAEIDDTARIPEFIARAWEVATSGRPGPVVLSLPEDVLSSSAAVPDLPPCHRDAPTPAPEAIASVEAELRRARQPLVIVGGSCWTDEACRLLRHFAEGLSLPVAASFRRQDLLDNNHASYIGHLSLGSPRSWQTGFAPPTSSLLWAPVWETSRPAATNCSKFPNLTSA